MNRLGLATVLSALLLAACAAPGSSPASDAEDPAALVAERVPAAERRPEPGEAQRAPAAEDEHPEEDADPEVDAPPAPEPFELLAGEIAPEAKQVAVDVVQALTTYEADQSLEEVVAAATDDPEAAAQVLEAAGPLHHEGRWSRGEVVYPQLGGLEPREVSVMTVVRQTVGDPDGVLLEVSRTLDVRVHRVEGVWRLQELASAGGTPAPRPDDVSPAAEAVLDDERIELPDTARWDIHRGRVADELLQVMALMAERTPYRVTVLDTGHPWEVFGTERQSRHSQGRAVDVHALDGPHVLEQREEGSEVHAFVRWLYEQEVVANIGSPWALDGFGGRSFTDDLHQDHLHISVR